MAKKRIVIIGAGLSGLSAAWHLLKKGFEPLVFEKEPEAGGLCRSKKVGGFIFDTDGHLLHFKHPYAFELVKGLLNGNLKEHRKNSWIYSYGRYTRYPFQANLYGLPPAIIKECLVEFIRSSNNGYSRQDANFFDWINHKFGKGIARHFMLPYNTKFWTVHPREMNCLWLDGFIPTPSLRRVIEGTVHENKKPLGYNAHFWYPKKGGIGQLAVSLASRVRHIFTDTGVTGIDPRKKELTLSSGARERYDYLISTAPLPEVPHLMGGIPRAVLDSFARLKWNSIYNINLGVSSPDGTRRHWVYFPEKAFSFFRVGFYHAFSPSLAPAQVSSLYAEVSYSKERPLDKAGVLPRVEDDLQAAGIIEDKDQIYLRQVNDIEYGYPIYDKHYERSREAITQYLNSLDIFPCGRYGSWGYYSMEGAIMDGKRAAELFR
jgi:protoporphyrinogen oxidase